MIRFAVCFIARAGKIQNLAEYGWLDNAHQPQSFQVACSGCLEMHQAARVSDQCAFFLHGEVVEYGPTTMVFENPRDERTLAYVSGRLA